MKISAYQTEMKKLLDQRNGYLLLSVGLVALALVLAFVIIFLCGKERIVLVPPTMNKETWIDSKSASTDYLGRMTVLYAELALNVTPENVDFQQETLLRNTDSSYYKILKPVLLKNADKIKKENISTAFFMTDIKVDVKNKTGIITGDLKSYVGDTALPSKRVTYRIRYDINAFYPVIKTFEEIKNA